MHRPLRTIAPFLAGLLVCPLVAAGLIAVKDTAAAWPVPAGVADGIRRAAFGLCMIWPFGVLVLGGVAVWKGKLALGVGLMAGVPLAGALYGIVYHGWLGLF